MGPASGDRTSSQRSTEAVATSNPTSRHGRGHRGFRDRSDYLKADRSKPQGHVAALLVDVEDDQAGQEVTAMLASPVDQRPASVEGAFVIIEPSST